MSGHISFNKVVSDWIGDHSWPRGSNQPQSIVAVTKKNSTGTVFEFQAGFGYLQIDGVYDKDANTLVDVRVQVAAPRHPAVTVAEAEYYRISTAEGALISFDLENGYVKGSVSFKYGNEDGRRDIFATYSVHLPFAGDLKGTIDIGPTEVTEVSGFTAAQLKAIVDFTPSELKAVEDKVFVSSKPGQPAIRAPNAASEKELTKEQALFIKFLKDFVISEGSVIIETYYPPADEQQTPVTNFVAKSLFVADAASKQWHASISFLDVLELDASVDPGNFTITATLFARVPIIGRVSLAKIQGSLLGGVTVNINIAVAKGKVTFSAAKNKGGKHELFVDATLSITHLHTIKTNGKKLIFTFPF